MTILASGSRGNCALIASATTRVLVDAGLSCREVLRRLCAAGEDPAQLDAILITHEHQDHVAGLSVLARRLGVPVFFSEGTHRAWVRMMTPRTTMTYAQWLEQMAREREARAAEQLPAHLQLEANKQCGAEASAGGPDRQDELPEAEQEAAEQLASEGKDGKAPRTAPSWLPQVEYFRPGKRFSIGDIDVDPFTIPHDAADPCGFVFHARSESLRMAIATDLGYVPPNVKEALRNVDVLLLESNHDLEMLKDGPYPWSVKQRVLSRVGHLSNDAAAEFLLRDYDGGAHTIVLGHLSESNNLPDLARFAAEQAIGDRLSLLGNRIVLARQHESTEPICL